jgi:hypothetical protein
MTYLCHCPNASPRSTGFVDLTGKLYCMWCKSEAVEVGEDGKAIVADPSEAELDVYREGGSE